MDFTISSASSMLLEKAVLDSDIIHGFIHEYVEGGIWMTSERSS